MSRFIASYSHKANTTPDPAGMIQSPTKIPDQTSDTADQLEQMLLDLVREISSIRAGKTFVPSHYTGPVAKQIRQWISDGIGQPEVEAPEYDEDTFVIARNKLRQEIRKNLGIV